MSEKSKKNQQVFKFADLSKYSFKQRLSIRIADLAFYLLISLIGRTIRFEIEGPAQIIATDNGDPTSFESFQSPARKAFNGLCLVIVRANPGSSGTIKLMAKSDGLKIGKTTIKSTRVDAKK